MNEIKEKLIKLQQKRELYLAKIAGSHALPERLSNVRRRFVEKINEEWLIKIANGVIFRLESNDYKWDKHLSVVQLLEKSACESARENPNPEEILKYDNLINIIFPGWSDYVGTQTKPGVFPMEVVNSNVRQWLAKLIRYEARITELNYEIQKNFEEQECMPRSRKIKTDK